MKTYNYPTASVKVTDCEVFSIAEVFVDGKKVHEIRTTKKDKKAADLAIFDARHCRII